MSDLSDLRIHLVSPYSRTAVVSPWDFPMSCEYEYEKGEPCRASGPPDSWDPGYPANVVLLTCTVGGVDITEMISNDQRDRIEEQILEQLES